MTTPSVHVSVAGRTDVGRTREHNEDTYLVADLSTGKLCDASEAQVCHVGPRGSLFMVADGMGGAAAGELASALAAEAIHQHLMKTWAAESDTSREKFAFRVREAVEEANRQIHAYAKAQPRRPRHGDDGDGGRRVRIRPLPRADRRQPRLHGPPRAWPPSSPRTSRSPSGWWTPAR